MESRVKIYKAYVKIPRDHKYACTTCEKKDNNLNENTRNPWTSHAKKLFVNVKDAEINKLCVKKKLKITREIKSNAKITL